MTGEVVLSSALRNNLLSLQRTQSSIDKTQGVLATGLKVSSALDNPQSFFASQSLKNRSSDLTRLLDGIGQSIQTIKAADAGVTSLTKLVQQAQSIADSARDAISSGAKEAAITGTVDLSGVTGSGPAGGITNLAGVDAAGNSEIVFTVKKADGTAVTLNNVGANGAGTVKLAVGDSIDQIVTKINDLVNSATGTAVLKAEVSSGGKLKITALEGASFTAAFDFNGTGTSETVASGNSTADQGLAAALGFGTVAALTGAGGATSAAQANEVSVTALSSTKLTSGTFYAEAGTGFATASALLTSVVTTEGGATERFTADSTSNISFTVNGSKTSVGYNIATGTIQGLIDNINNDATIGNLVEASYDATTGKFAIESIDASVSSIKVNSNIVTGGTVTGTVDFDFGTKAALTTLGTATTTSETFVLASAASVLSQYEDDYNTIRTQIDELVEDSGYRGVNLLAGDTLDTYFNEDRSNKLSTTGTTLNAAGLGLGEADFSTLTTIEATASEARNGLTALRSFGGTLSNSLSVIQTRENFTKTMVETLNEGSDKLTVADQNEEGAKLLALQTRQQLGVTALSLAAQAQQSVLRLF